METTDIRLVFGIHGAHGVTPIFFYLCRNHPFVDGNQRPALATCLVFLSENGLLPCEKLDTDAWESLTLNVTASQLDQEQTAARLRKLLRVRAQAQKPKSKF
jgi:prophage maintenance system killer protein